MQNLNILSEGFVLWVKTSSPLYVQLSPRNQYYDMQEWTMKLLFTIKTGTWDQEQYVIVEQLFHQRRIDSLPSIQCTYVSDKVAIQENITTYPGV